MTSERFSELMGTPDCELTAAELAKGWHWCGDFDGLLVGPSMSEMDCCTCPGIPFKSSILKGDDGFYVFWPDEGCGSFSAANLREIADWLDARNKDWNAMVTDALNADPDRSGPAL